MADPQQLTPDSFMASQADGPTKGLTPDSFMQSFHAGGMTDDGKRSSVPPAPSTPQKLSQTLPHPDQVVQEATDLGRVMADMATRPQAPPTQQPNPSINATIEATHPGLLERMFAPVREGQIGRALGISTETAESRKEDPSTPVLRFESALDPNSHGVARGAAEFASSLTTPENLLLMVGSGGLGTLEKQLGKGLVSRLVSAGFSGQMLHDAYKQHPALREAWNKEDWPMVRQTLTRMALGTGMAGLAARSAVKGEKTNVPQKAETQPQTTQPEQPAAAQGQPAGPAQHGDQPAAVAPAAPAAAGAPAAAVEGGNSGEYFRGDWNVKLNADGKRQAAEAAARTAGQFDEIRSGTKDRHRETAQAYARTSTQAGEVKSSPAFDPMHMGEHEGERVTPERIAAVNEHLRTRPDEPIPGVGKFSGSPGEKPAEWSGRLIGGVQDAIAGWKPGKKTLIVTSGRDVQAVRAWVAKGMPGDRSLDPGVLTSEWQTQPGGMMRLDPRTGKVEDVAAADKEGIYFARHGETDANANGAVPAEVAGSDSPGEPVPSQVSGAPPAERGEVDARPSEVSTGDDGVYFGTGLGALEPLFRQTKAEGDRLRLARNAALEAAKAAQASPAEKKAGEAVRSYFTAERDLWAARANQALDIVTRTVLPKLQDREAVGIMREFKAKPRELQQFIDGSHPYLQEADGGVSNAMARLDRLRPVMEHALRMLTGGITPNEAKADRLYTNIAEKSLQEGIKGGWLASRWQSYEYLPHLINPKGEGEVAKLPSLTGRKQGQIGKYFGFGQRRADQYPTMVHAVADGLIPKTLDASAAFVIHAEDFARARATHLLEAHLADSGLGKWGDGKHVPDGWVQLAQHSEEFKKNVGYPVAGSMDPETGLPEIQVGTMGLYVPEFIDKALSPITDPDYMAKLPGFAKVRTLQRGLKEAILGLSGFHLLTENVMAKADIGVSEMVRALKAQRESPGFLVDERDLIASGGSTSIQGRTMDAYRSLRPGTIPTRGEVIRGYIPGSKQMLAAADDITRLTFDNVQRRFKVVSFAVHRNAWMRDNPMAAPDQLAEAKKGIASYVNGVFGGLHWENMGIGRMALEVGRFLLLAPDWSGSNVALGKYAFDAPLSRKEFGGAPLSGAITKESVQARLSRAFWTKQIVQGLVENQMLSLLFSGRMSPRPFQVYLGKDKEGRDIYQNVVWRGSVGDAVSLGSKIEDHGPFVGTGVFLGSNAAPLTKLGIHTMTGRNDLGQEIAPKSLGFIPNTVRSVGALLSDISPIPIVVRSAYKTSAGDDSDTYRWSERMLSLFGPMSQHVAPEGTRYSKTKGLVPFEEKEPQSVWDEIVSGKR